jgi:predicted SprT family Zn-dependent metalloprotease
VTRDFNTLLAHELIHAWQEENRKAETHGKHFKKLAKQLESQFGFTEIYIKGIDEK